MHPLDACYRIFLISVAHGVGGALLDGPQFVNLFLFFVGVALIGAAVVLVKATYPIKARWDTYANADLKVRCKPCDLEEKSSLFILICIYLD